MTYLMGIDAGTSAMKAILYDRQGTVCAEGVCEYQLATGAAGTVECDPEVYWFALKTVLGQIFSPVAPGLRSVQALAISCQAETFVVIDKTGKPAAQCHCLA